MMGRRLLLDVNVWLALFDDAHPYSPPAHALLARQPLIALCPLTENGTLRIMNSPRYSRLGPVGFERVRQSLRAVCTDLDHRFWPDDISLRADDVLDFTRISGHNQLTDAYLLALAVKHGGALATFDQRITLHAVRGATPNHLLVL
ncbi:MAG: PIN domain-containing protein [Pseudomonadota bacterium]|nr:PIN domain-containing protein [Pseudomonadota bacterium]